MLGAIATSQMIEIALPHAVMLRFLQFEEGEDHLSTRFERTKGVARVEIGLSGIEMGENRPVKNHIERSVWRDDPGRDVQQDIIVWTLVGQFIDQFLYYIRAGIMALPSGASQCLCRAAAATTQIIDSHAIDEAIMAQHHDMAVADRDEVHDGRCAGI